jgi:hypothetical protein
VPFISAELCLFISRHGHACFEPHHSSPTRVLGLVLRCTSALSQGWGVVVLLCCCFSSAPVRKRGASPHLQPVARRCSAVMGAGCCPLISTPSCCFVQATSSRRYSTVPRGAVHSLQFVVLVSSSACMPILLSGTCKPCQRLSPLANTAAGSRLNCSFTFPQINPHWATTWRCTAFLAPEVLNPNRSHSARTLSSPRVTLVSA